MMFSNASRRARLSVRHRLGQGATDVGEGVVAVAALHSSDPLTPYLALWARVRGFIREDLDAALLDDRSLCRMHAMRRTLFIVPTEDVPIFEAGAARAIAVRERTRLRKWLAVVVADSEVDPRLDQLTKAIYATLAQGERHTKQLRAALPELGLPVVVGSGKWTQEVPIGTKLLPVLAMEGRIVRTRTAGTWRSSQYAWSDPVAWFGQVAAGLEPKAARGAVIERYLAAYGPATLTDVRWWTGWTAGHVKAALSLVGAEVVSLASGEGWVLPGDVELEREAPPQVALLPGLDPAPMGWKEREWMVGDYAGRLFDRNGNAGPTLWWDGRVIGGWAVRDSGEVVTQVFEDIGALALAEIEREAGALTDWLDGEVPVPRFRTPLERELSG